MCDLEPVPCGKCPSCLSRKASGWSFRLMQELKGSSSGYFITLTYDTKHVPLTRNGFMDLNPSHLQKFIKRLRYYNEQAGNYIPLKYYGVGEYGSRTKRPHYHVILFNSRLESIGTAWTQGQIHYGSVTLASVGYVLKYISKNTYRKRFHRDDRSEEFSRMSKGLGQSYLTQNMLNWHHGDLLNRMYCTIEDGKKIAMPRYYKERIYNTEERELVGSHQLQQIILRRNEEIEKLGLEEYERLQREKMEAEFRNLNLSLFKKGTL